MHCNYEADSNVKAQCEKHYVAKLLDQGHSAKNLGNYRFLVQLAAIACSQNVAGPYQTDNYKEERCMEDW